jgi:hypothetical protein
VHGVRWIAVAVFISASAQAEVTPAQRKEAATHYQRGVALSKDGDYAAALAEFRAAYDAAPSFEVLFNIGLCERRTFRYGQALRTFAAYLEQGGAKVPGERRKAVAQEIEQVRALTAPVAVIVEGEPATIFIDGEHEGTTPFTDLVPLGPGKHVLRAERAGDQPEERAITVVSGQAQAVQFSLKSLSRPVEVRLETRPVGALVSIDGAAAGAAPLTVSLPPGTHEVTARLDGYTSARTDVIVQPGQPRSVALELVALPAAAPPPGKFPVLGVSLLSAGLVSGGLGIFFAVKANAAETAVNGFVRMPGATWTDDWARTERVAKEQQLAAQLLLGGAGALGVAGLVATFVTVFSEPSAPKVSIIPTPSGVSASCVVSF